MSIKIAMIGAGSIGFTRKLLHDVLAVPELQATTFALMDISEPNLRRKVSSTIGATGSPMSRTSISPLEPSGSTQVSPAPRATCSIIRKFRPIAVEPA